MRTAYAGLLRLRFEIRYNLFNLASEVIGHDTEESADSVFASAGDGAAAAVSKAQRDWQIRTNSN